MSLSEDERILERNKKLWYNKQLKVSQRYRNSNDEENLTFL